VEAALVRFGGAATFVLQVAAGVRAVVAVPRLAQHGPGGVRAPRVHPRARRRGPPARGGASLARRHFGEQPSLTYH